MRYLIIYGALLTSCFSCQEDVDCDITYRTRSTQSNQIDSAKLEQALSKTNGPFTDACYTFSSHCFEEIEELKEWLQSPPGHTLEIRAGEDIWYLDGAKAQILADTTHLRWWIENLLYYGEVTDCRLEQWSLGDIYDYSRYLSRYLDTIKAIAHHNRLSSGSVGLGGRRPQQFNRVKWLLGKLTTEELLSLIVFPNPVVKAIAFEGLYRHQYPNLFPILLHFATLENHYLVYSSGCIGHRLHLSQYCFSWIMNYSSKHAPPPPTPSPYHYSALTAAQQEIISEQLEKHSPYW